MSSAKIRGEACGGDEEILHVLAVDDSSVDRAVISRLLRSSKCRGRWFCFSPSYPPLNSCANGISLRLAVTAVDSGKKALELLGLVSCCDALFHRIDLN